MSDCVKCGKPIRWVDRHAKCFEPKPRKPTRMKRIGWQGVYKDGAVTPVYRNKVDALRLHIAPANLRAVYVKVEEGR